MDWGKVIYVFFALMSLTSIVGFLYESSAVELFVAACLNLVADLHLIPAFIYLELVGNLEWAIALTLGALIANLFSVGLVYIESSKSRDEY